MSIKISVIIPVYNAEKYIKQCVESLLGQTIDESEFIFINDGSTDKSSEILESYKKKDSRVIVIHQQNMGVSIARNQGLKIASGEYVGFVDADDYIEKDMFEVLYNSAKQSDCDVVISNFEAEIEGQKVITKYSFPIDITLKTEYIEKEILLYFLKKENLNAVWNKIYKNEVIRENHVKFPEKVVLGEDELFNIQIFSHATSVKYIDYTGYYYREVEGSATRNILKNDYFSEALDKYKLEFPEIYTNKIDKVKIHQLKSIRLVKNVMSYIHIYFSPSKDVSFSKRYRYVKTMLDNKYVREALPIYYDEIYSSLGRYEKLMINMIKGRFTVGLYCVTAYSRSRNKLHWRN